MAGALLNDAVEVKYRGPVTLGASGRARLHGCHGGMADMVWEALDRAGWVGEIVSLRTTVSLQIGVTAAPAERSKERARLQPLPGDVREVGERGWVDDRGVAWQGLVGPLNARAARGYRLLESQRLQEDFEVGEDLLYTAVFDAGWLGEGREELADVPDVQITIAVARRNPRWEAFAHPDDNLREPDPVPTEPAGSRDPGHHKRLGEQKLLEIALDVAARAGDPNPELIQYAYGSRFDVTRTTGSVVFSDAPSCIVVMKGNFRWRRSRRPSRRDFADETGSSYRFQMLVIDTETGQVTDSGSSSHRPDLTPLGEVITADRSRSAG